MPGHYLVGLGAFGTNVASACWTQLTPGSNCPASHCILTIGIAPDWIAQTGDGVLRKGKHVWLHVAPGPNAGLRAAQALEQWLGRHRLDQGHANTLPSPMPVVAVSVDEELPSNIQPLVQAIDRATELELAFRVLCHADFPQHPVANEDPAHARTSRAQVEVWSRLDNCLTGLRLPPNRICYLIGAEAPPEGLASDEGRFILAASSFYLRLSNEPELEKALQRAESSSGVRIDLPRYFALGLQDIHLDQRFVERRVSQRLLRSTLLALRDSGASAGEGDASESEEIEHIANDLVEQIHQIATGQLVQVGKLDTSPNEAVLEELAEETGRSLGRRPECPSTASQLLARIRLTSKIWAERFPSPRPTLVFPEELVTRVARSLKSRLRSLPHSARFLESLFLTMAYECERIAWMAHWSRHREALADIRQSEVAVWSWHGHRRGPTPPLQREWYLNRWALFTVLAAVAVIVAALYMLQVLVDPLFLGIGAVFGVLVALMASIRSRQLPPPPPPPEPIGPMETIGRFVQTFQGVEHNRAEVRGGRELGGLLRALAHAFERLKHYSAEIVEDRRPNGSRGRWGIVLNLDPSDELESLWEGQDGLNALLEQHNLLEELLSSMIRHPLRLTQAYRTIRTLGRSTAEAILAKHSPEDVFSQQYLSLSKLDWPAIEKWAESVPLLWPPAVALGIEGSAIVGVGQRSGLLVAKGKARPLTDVVQLQTLGRLMLLRLAPVRPVSRGPHGG